VDWLLFHSMRDKNLELYRLVGVEGAEDSSLTNLTEDEEALESQPSRSWNQEWVTYQSNTNGNWDVYLTDQLGMETIQLTDSDADEINPVFSHDNQTIAFQSNENDHWDIYIVDRLTGEIQRVTDMSGNEINPYFSPSGDWLVFQSDQSGNWDVYLLYLPTGYHYRVTDTEVHEINPSWSPNGRHLAFLRQNGEDWALILSGMYGGEQLTISTDTPRNPSWAPDGWRIAYQAMVEENIDIYYYDLTTYQNNRVTTEDGPDTQPSWNCDGSKIAFTSSREGDNQNIFSVMVGSETVTQMTRNEADDKWSLWFISKEFGSKSIAEIKYNENKPPKRSP
jgi:Tol biopolymer transport system component